MQTMLMAAKVLTDIRQGTLTFADFSNQLRGRDYQALSGQAKREVRTFVSCALHKQEISRFALLQYGLDELQALNQSIVSVFLCNRYFLKIVKVDGAMLIDAITDETDKELVKAAEIITGDVKSMFPPQLDFKTPFALSLRYNFPIDFIERLIDDLGFNKTQRFLDKYSNVYQIHGRVNIAKITLEQFFATNPDFSAIPLTNAFVYSGRVSIKSLQSYKDCMFYTMPLTDLIVAEQIAALAPSTLLIIEQEKTSMIIDLAKQNIDLKIHMLVSDKHRYHVVGSMIKMFELTNTSVATLDRLEEEELYDLVYLTPTSSNLDQIKARPDFFNSFDLYADYATPIYAALLEGKKHVKDGGCLVVKIGTMLKNETSDLAQRFVKENNDYTLEYERQYMPYHKEQLIAYYAIFRKKKPE